MSSQIHVNGMVVNLKDGYSTSFICGKLFFAHNEFRIKDVRRSQKHPFTRYSFERKDIVNGKWIRIVPIIDTGQEALEKMFEWVRILYP